MAPVKNGFSAGGSEFAAALLSRDYFHSKRKVLEMDIVESLKTVSKRTVGSFSMIPKQLETEKL